MLKGGLGRLRVEQRNTDGAGVFVRRIDLGPILAARQPRVVRQVGVRAEPVAMLGSHMLDGVICFVNVRQWGLLQTEQQYRTQDNRKQSTHCLLF